MVFECENAGRLDVFLAEKAEITRSRAASLIKDGAVTVNGKVPAKAGCELKAGDRVEFTPPEPVPTDVVAQDIPLDIVYQDNDLAVVYKPSGMVVHPAAGNFDGTMVNALLAKLDNLSGIGGEIRPGIVHRIDKDTSGLLIVAKNDFAHQKLAAQLKDHTLSRTYEAIVCGSIREDEGTVDAPIGRHPVDRKKMAVTDKNSRNAVTHYTVLGRYRGYTHVQCRLETGRTHQIRVHMAYKSHPILGDTVYGHKGKELGMDTQCLHARKLTFVHPRTEKPVTVECPLPDYFEEVLKKLQTL